MTRLAVLTVAVLALANLLGLFDGRPARAQMEPITPPPVTVTLSGPAGKQSGPFDVTLTFSEKVKLENTAPVHLISVVNGKPAVSNATPTSPDTDGGAKVWTVRVIPQNFDELYQYNKTEPFDVTIEVYDEVAYAGSGDMARYNEASNSLKVPVDLPPTVELSSRVAKWVDEGFNVYDGYIIDVVFSESVKGLELADFTVTGGTASRLAGEKYSYIFFVTASAPGTVTVGLPANKVTDSANQGNTAATSIQISDVFEYTRPAVTITGPDGPVEPTSSMDITLTFTHKVTDLEAADVFVRNGTVKSGPTAENPENGYAAVWKMKVSPNSVSGRVEVQLPSNKVFNSVRNTNTASNRFEVQISTARGVKSCSGSVGDIRLVDGGIHGSTEEKPAGRLEICHDSKWKGICHDGWDDDAAEVACSQLGYSEGTAKTGLLVGRSSQPPIGCASWDEEGCSIELLGSQWLGWYKVDILLDDVDCDGDEDKVTDCEHAGYGIHNCTDYEHAGVTCGPASGD